MLLSRNLDIYSIIQFSDVTAAFGFPRLRYQSFLVFLWAELFPKQIKHCRISKKLLKENIAYIWHCDHEALQNIIKLLEFSLNFYVQLHRLSSKFLGNFRYSLSGNLGHLQKFLLQVAVRSDEFSDVDSLVIFNSKFRVGHFLAWREVALEKRMIWTILGLLLENCFVWFYFWKWTN